MLDLSGNKTQGMTETITLLHGRQCLYTGESMPPQRVRPLERNCRTHGED
jgi:hypothetical protein